MAHIVTHNHMPVPRRISGQGFRVGDFANGLEHNAAVVVIVVEGMYDELADDGDQEPAANGNAEANIVPARVASSFVIYCQNP